MLLKPDQPLAADQAAKATGSQPSTSGGAGALPDSQTAQERIQQMLQAPSQPSSETSYYELYTYPEYKKNVERKGKKMRRVLQTLRTESFATAIESDAYLAELARISDTYPEDGNCGHLFELVGNSYLLSFVINFIYVESVLIAVAVRHKMAIC